MDAFDIMESLDREDAQFRALDLLDASGRPSFKHYANRMLYSRYYQAYYVVITVLSLLAFAMLLYHRWYPVRLHQILTADGSTTKALIVLELAINSAMVVEIGVRLVALNDRFLESWGNVMDLVVVMLCVLTLLVVRDKCTGALDAELSLDAVVLVLRNAVQAARLWRTVKRSHKQKQPERINFDGLMVVDAGPGRLSIK